MLMGTWGPPPSRMVQCPEPLCEDGRINPTVAPELCTVLERDELGYLVCGICLGEGVIDRDDLTP